MTEQEAIQSLVDAECHVGKPLETIANPKWDEGSHVHNWRTHVDDEVVDAWEHINTAGRLAILLMAQRLASNEEWD